MNTVTTAAIISAVQSHYEDWDNRIKTETNAARLQIIEIEHATVIALVRQIAFPADERAGDELRKFITDCEPEYWEAYDKREQALSKK